ncbi:hypothetical protein B0H14DRAFT_2766321 [Mycena olivaceomarginata]|nr:hypothetical protein B0H14DRAFT_2766321 [Mycena olivaceomarginata]
MNRHSRQTFSSHLFLATMCSLHAFAKDANFEATNPHCYSLKKTTRQRTLSRQDTRSRDDRSLNLEGNTVSDPSPDGHWEGGDTVDGMVIPANSSRTIASAEGIQCHLTSW